MSLPSNPSFSALLEELGNDLATLVRQEVALVRAELSLSVAGLARAIAVVAAGAVVAMAGLLALLAAVVLIAIALGLAPWASALGVGIGLLIAGGLTVKWGLGRLTSVAIVPAETIASLKEDVRWLRTQWQK